MDIDIKWIYWHDNYPNLDDFGEDNTENNDTTTSNKYLNESNTRCASIKSTDLDALKYVNYH